MVESLSKDMLEACIIIKDFMIWLETLSLSRLCLRISIRLSSNFSFVKNSKHSCSTARKGTSYKAGLLSFMLVSGSLKQSLISSMTSLLRFISSFYILWYFEKVFAMWKLSLAVSKSLNIFIFATKSWNLIVLYTKSTITPFWDCKRAIKR